jgi:hypothetical protein
LCIEVIGYNDGVGIILPDPDNPPDWQDTDDPWGYRDPASTLYDDTLSDVQDTQKCEKANLFLYLSIEKLETISILFAAGSGIAAGVVAALSGVLAPLAFVTVGGVVVELGVTVGMIYGIADVIMTAIPSWGDFTYSISEDDKQDAVCRLYNATTAEAVKDAWDGWCDDHFEWFSPAAFLLRTFMTPQMANAIVNPNIVVREDEPRYLLSCDGCNTTTCAIGTYHITSVTCYYWHAGNKSKHSALVEWAEGDPCVHWNNEYDIGFRSTLNTPSPPWDDGSNGRGAYCWQVNDGSGLQIRLIQNNTPQYPTKLYYWGASISSVALPTDGSPVTVPPGTNYWIVGYVHGAFANFTPDFTIVIEAI